MTYRNSSGQQLAPTVSGFASQPRVPDKRPASSILGQQGALPGLRSYRNMAANAERRDIQPRTSLVTYDWAMDQISSAPGPGSVHSSGCINPHNLRPSTAPILVPSSPVTDIPAQGELPFGPKLRSTNKGSSPIPAVPATSHSLTKLSETENQEARTQVQKVDQATTPGSMAARPALSGDKTVGAVKEPVSAGPIRAEDIDTQKLLEKVATRRSKSTKKEQNPRTGAKSHPTAQSHNSTASQKRKKNVSCTQCRSKKTKCGSHGEDPDQACQPCLDAGRDCSFVAHVENIVGDGAVMLVKPELQMQRPQDTSLKVLRSREIYPVDATAVPASQEIPIQEIKQTKANGFNLPMKRSSQLAMPAPKRFKAQKNGVKPNPQIAGRNTRSRKHEQRNTSFQPPSSHHAVQELSNSPTHPRSDATTATVDTLDLDPTEKPQETTRKLSPLRPLYSELSATTDHSGPPDNENRPPRPLHQPEVIADPAPTPKTTTASSTSIFAQPLADLTNLSPTEQNAWLDQTFIDALQDDSFIPFCEMISSRWEQHLFNFNLKQ